jgi:uncharacterized membrane protein YfcA
MGTESLKEELAFWRLVLRVLIVGTVTAIIGRYTIEDPFAQTLLLLIAFVLFAVIIVLYSFYKSRMKVLKLLDEQEKKK